MKYKIFKGRKFNPGDKTEISQEVKLSNVSFTSFKFNNRPRPTNKNQILIVTCFSEFGCESIGLHYGLPRVMSMYPGAYIIAVGWYGREYLYRHLVDEYWEIGEEYQFLREYCRAFHFDSDNLKKIHEKLSDYGQVMNGTYMSRFVLGNTCRSCRHFWQDSNYVDGCPKCQSPDIERSLFGDIPFWRKRAVPIPKPNRIEEAKSYLKPGCKHVGVFARGRKCYGRNLDSNFYISLISLLRDKGYEPIWLGEKQSTQPCPVDDVIDFSRKAESRDLELTLSIISQLEFTVQFWTASTRLAAMVDTPYLLFESPDQIAGVGQEGYRMALTSDWDKKKLVLSHYLSVCEDHEGALRVVNQAIDEMMAGNWEHISGLVNNKDLVSALIRSRKLWER